jgi:hypothetical protein
MKKVIKYRSSLSKQEITFTIDESLNQLKGKDLAPKKLAEANQFLRTIKSPLPKAPK